MYYFSILQLEDIRFFKIFTKRCNNILFYKRLVYSIVIYYLVFIFKISFWQIIGSLKKETISLRKKRDIHGGERVGKLEWNAWFPQAPNYRPFITAGASVARSRTAAIHTMTWCLITKAVRRSPSLLIDDRVCHN